MPAVHSYPDTTASVLRLKQLAHDWDSYGSPPPTSASIEKALQIIASVDKHFRSMLDDKTSPYAVVPLPGGGVQLEWRGDNSEIEIDISPDGKIGYLYNEQRDGKDEYKEEDITSIQDLMGLVGKVLFNKTQVKK
jgi:hypothetical protein